MSDWRSIDNEGRVKQGVSRPVAPGRATPDVAVHLRIAAYLAGLGEIGWSKMFLTPQFGPRQRIGLVITEAELEPDPVMKPGTLCNRCKACVAQCPGHCIPADRSVKVTLAGHAVEWADLNCQGCNVAFRGGVVSEQPLSEELKYDMSGKNDLKPGWWSPFFRKPRNLYLSLIHI